METSNRRVLELTQQYVIEGTSLIKARGRAEQRALFEADVDAMVEEENNYVDGVPPLTIAAPYGYGFDFPVIG